MSQWIELFTDNGRRLVNADQIALVGWDEGVAVVYLTTQAKLRVPDDQAPGQVAALLKLLAPTRLAEPVPNSQSDKRGAAQ